MPNWEPAADRGLWALSVPRLSNPAKMRKKCCYGQKNLGQYVAVCLCLQLTSHTQPTSTLSRIKCERYIFIKKCVRSFTEVLIIVDYVSAYICICGYTIFIPIVIGALGTFIKGLIKGLENLEIRERVETIQTTPLLRSARILRRVPETWGDLLSVKVQWKTFN